MQKSTTTYFEQIPVAVVKKLVKELSSETNVGHDGVSRIDTPKVTTASPLHCQKKDSSMKTEEMTPDPKDLRELARRIQEEMDPNKMIELVKQLIAGFDEQQSLRKVQFRGHGTDNQPPARTPGSSSSDGAEGA